MPKIIDTFWTPLPPLVKGGIVVVAGVGGFIVGKRIYKKAEEKKRLRDLEKLYKDNQQTLVVNAGGGAGGQAVVQINLATQAQLIYDAFYNYAGGMFEDEQKAIDEIKKVPYALIKKLEDVYRKLYKKDLREDFVQYVDAPGDWGQVSHLFS